MEFVRGVDVYYPKDVVDLFKGSVASRSWFI